MNEKIKLNFEKISQLLRDEKRTHDKLVSVAPTFYEDIVEYLSFLRTEIDKLTRGKPESAKLQLLQDEYKKVSRKIKDIYKARERKIIFLALSKLDNARIDLNSMTPKEIELFNKLCTTIKEWREGILVAQPHSQPKREYRVVRVLEDLLEFVDKDKTYHLQKEDIVTLQPDTAELLVQKKKVKILL